MKTCFGEKETAIAMTECSGDRFELASVQGTRAGNAPDRGGVQRRDHQLRWRRVAVAGNRLEDEPAGAVQPVFRRSPESGPDRAQRGADDPATSLRAGAGIRRSQRPRATPP